MTQVLIYIEKFKWAIFGTVLVHVAVFVISMLSTVKRPLEIKEPEVRTELQMPQELELDEFEVENKMIDPETGEVINSVRNLNDKREVSDHFSKSNADQNVWDKTKNYEQSIKDELKANHQPDDSRDLYTDDKGQDVGKHYSSTNSSPNTQADGPKMIVDYDLGPRTEKYLPVAGYLCPGSGRVTIGVKVDYTGKVISASPIPSESQNATQCMYQVASKYARKSKFNYVKGASNREGKIYYTFVGQ